MKTRVWLALAAFGVAGALSSSAHAQTSGVKMYSPSTGERVRVGTSCSLRIAGQAPYRGLCNISYDRETMRTTIDTGARTYYIQRNDDQPDEGKFITASGRTIEFVSPSGSCWVGEIVKFCAN